MKQKIYEDAEDMVDMYNTKKATCVFVSISNGNMWRAITGNALPDSPLTPQIYEKYGFPWFKLYDDMLGDVYASDDLANVKSIKQIDNVKPIKIVEEIEVAKEKDANASWPLVCEDSVMIKKGPDGSTDAKMLYKHCEQCKLSKYKCVKLWLCSRCRAVRYCGRQGQKVSWNMNHRHVCNH